MLSSSAPLRCQSLQDCLQSLGAKVLLMDISGNVAVRSRQGTSFTDPLEAEPLRHASRLVQSCDTHCIEQLW